MEQIYGLASQQVPGRDFAIENAKDQELFATAVSYHKIIKTHCQKHESSLYANSSLRVDPLFWCLNVVREEAVRFPNVTSKDVNRYGRDELVLCLAGT